MPNYYSQHGEDYLLDLMFAGKNDGFFVEVGCIDGKRFSNTLHFEEKGWRGLCIEAHPDFIPLLKKNRPNSIVCNYAVGESDADNVVFYATDRGSLSTLDKSQETRWKKHYAKYFHGFEEKRVSKRTLTTIFNEQRVGHIDFISLDIEGYEVPALRGLDLAIFAPDVFVIETEDKKQKKEQEKILHPHGYFLAASIARNLFYTRDRALASRIQNICTIVPLIYTKHSIDDGGDITVHKMVDTTVRKSIFDRLFSK
jgi:FkbM family methyltransferase